LNTKLLVDGDYLVYKVGHMVEISVDWDSTGVYVYYGEIQRAHMEVDRLISTWLEVCSAEGATIFLSDLKANWRCDVLPSYKANRMKPRRRPTLFYGLRDYLKEVYGADYEERLEADDLIGIRATEKSKSKYVIVGEDKDFNSIPSQRWNPEKEEMHHITLEEADRNHLIQALMGDRTDNYLGCPGVGAKTAAKILDLDSSWAAVAAIYEKNGISEAEALSQARCARILRAGEYDFLKQKVSLWTP